MRELSEVFDAIDEARAAGETVILATVVRTRGSTYRRPGARMLITQEGRRVGTISGGCLESDLIKRAWWLTREGPATLAYDTLDEDDETAVYRLGCRGLVEVLLERITPETPPPTFAPLRSRIERGDVAVLATVIDPALGFERGERLLYDGSWTSESSNCPASIREQAETAYSLGRSRSIVSDGLGVFLEVVRPATPLVLCGGGYDAVPVARLAKELGWHVTVVDRRASCLARFPQADMTLAATPSAALASLKLTPRSNVVLMTHSPSDDVEYLRGLFPSEAGYIGMLGPRHRAEKVLNDLAEGGFVPTARQLARLHSPIGLDLGADAPEEIALAILAEIQAHVSRRSASPLRDCEGPIHDRFPIDDSPISNVVPSVCHFSAP